MLGSQLVQISNIRIWLVTGGGEAYELEIHLLRVNISNLRREIEKDPARPHFILTEPGVGYRMRLES